MKTFCEIGLDLVTKKYNYSFASITRQFCAEKIILKKVLFKLALYAVLVLKGLVLLTLGFSLKLVVVWVKPFLCPVIQAVCPTRWLNLKYRVCELLFWVS